MYIEPWHCDIVSFLDAKKNHGNEDDRARDLFYALWIPDLFMERIEKDEDWSLMCPDECRGLDDVYGEEFNKLYMEYEEKGMFRKKMPARKLWQYVIDSQIETGTPYICYKDSVNKRSNQKEQ
jgi:ribonucleotide reductase alpha subunit